MFEGAPRRSSATSRTRSRRSSPTGRSSSRSARRCACSSATRSGSCPEELELYFDDIVDAAERIWDLLDNYKEVVEGARVDERVGDLPPPERRPAPPHGHQRHVLPLTLIAGIFGMNVLFPGEGATRPSG